MPTHDCSICKATDKCPITDIAPWLNDHEDEVDKATKDEAKVLAQACILITASSPLTMLIPIMDDAIVTAIGMAFDIGFHKGRHFPTVPKAFEET